MIFGGWGRKAKQRGEVFFVCAECQKMNVFGLVENYGYGQVYGVRIAKYGTDRFLLCTQCQSGWDLSKEQWDFARQVATVLAAQPVLTTRQIAESCVTIAHGVLPEMESNVREFLSEMLLAPDTPENTIEWGEKDPASGTFASVAPPEPVEIPEFMSYLERERSAQRTAPRGGNSGNAASGLPPSVQAARERDAGSRSKEDPPLPPWMQQANEEAAKADAPPVAGRERNEAVAHDQLLPEDQRPTQGSDGDAQSDPSVEQAKHEARERLTQDAYGGESGSPPPPSAPARSEREAPVPDDEPTEEELESERKAFRYQLAEAAETAGWAVSLQGEEMILGDGTVHVQALRNHRVLIYSPIATPNFSEDGVRELNADVSVAGFLATYETTDGRVAWGAFQRLSVPEKGDGDREISAGPDELSRWLNAAAIDVVIANRVFDDAANGS